MPIRSAVPPTVHRPSIPARSTQQPTRQANHCTRQRAAALGAGLLLMVGGAYVDTGRFEDNLSCPNPTTRFEHTFPHIFTGEVYVRIGAPAGALRANLTLAWGAWRYRRQLDVPPAARGGLLLLFTKKNGLSQPNYDTILASTKKLCVQWGTGGELINPATPTGLIMLATGWVEGHDRV